MQITVLVDGKENGPYTVEDVRKYLATGQLQPQMLAWREGMQDWQELGSYPEFHNLGGKTPAGTKSARTSLYVGLAVISVTLIGLLGWQFLRGTGSGSTQIGKAENSPPAAAESSDPSLPQTLEALQEYYKDPAAGQNAASYFLKSVF